MILILTEKREAASDMAATLGDAGLGSDAGKLAQLGKQKGYLEGEAYLLTWAAGHLFSQITPKEIDPKYGLYQKFDDLNEYKMGSLRHQIKHIPTPDKYKKKQRNIIKTLLARADVTEIIIATDADAEGEAIGRDMIFRIAGRVSVPIKRFWNTGSFKAKESVQKAMGSLLPYDDPKFENLYASQQARSLSDYLTGMKVTKVLTDLYNKPFYIGRVKGVILSLIGNRSLEIERFVAKDFWQIKGAQGELELSNFFFQEVEDTDAEGHPITKKEKQRNYYDRQTVDRVLDDLEDLSGVVTRMSISTSSSKKRPLPLSGSDFASEMMGKYKISYAQCNDILDYLRREGFTTYPGTNGRYFAHTDKEEVMSALSAASTYFRVKDDAPFTTDTYIFNDKKAAKQNHTPLSITPNIPTPADFAAWEKHKLPHLKEAYEMIARRIVVAFLPDDAIEKQELIVTMNTGGHTFDLTGHRAVKQGWRTFMGMEVKDTTFSGAPHEGDAIVLDKVFTKTGKTKPPAPYTLKTLLDTLLNISRVVDKLIAESNDPATIKRFKMAKRQLKDAEGIGTDRTRETIISDLVKNKMIQARGKEKKLELTEGGWELYKVLPLKLKNVVLTATWERRFEEIRRGEVTLEKVISDIDHTIMEEMIPYVIDNLGKVVPVAEKKQPVKATEVGGVLCPLCESPLLETDKVFRCSKNIYKGGRRSGCAFSIFKDQTRFFGRSLTPDDLPALFSATKDSPLKDGSHGIYFDPENKYFATVAFDDEETRSGSDDGKLVEAGNTYRKGAKFVFSEFRGKKLTPTQAEALLDGGSVTLERKSKGGKTYKVKCTLKDNGGLDTTFV